MPSFLLKLLLPMVLNLIHRALHNNKAAVAGFVSAEMEKGLTKLDIPFLPDADELMVKTNLRLIAQNVVSSGLDYVEANGDKLIQKVVK